MTIWHILCNLLLCSANVGDDDDDDYGDVWGGLRISSTETDWLRFWKVEELILVVWFRLYNKNSFE